MPRCDGLSFQAQVFCSKFSAHSRASSGTKLSTVVLCRRLDGDMGAVAGQASPVEARASPIRSPSSTARKSGRIRDSGLQVADKAARRAAARDLPASGTPPAPSQLVHSTSSPTRLVLPSYSDEHLTKVLADSGISLDHNFGSPSSLIALIRSNEVAQEALAKAKEAVAAPPAPSVVAAGVSEEGGSASDVVPQPSVKKGVSKRAKALAPCRSSLHIKDLSFR